MVFYADAGGGHRATAEALRELLEETGRFRVTLLNPYRDLIPHFDLTARITGQTGEAFYNDVVLRRGRTGLTCWLFYALLKLNYLLYGRATVGLLAERFARLAPDLVVSVIPLANGVILQALQRYRRQSGRSMSDVPLSVLITDWREIAAGVWFPRKGGYHAICGTRDSAAQARRLSRQRNVTLHETTGLLIRPRFATAPTPPAELGLSPDRVVVTVLYGAQGSARMLMVADALSARPAADRARVQVVFLCGRDAAVAAALRAKDLGYDARIVGFTEDVASYLAASALFVGKPGPGSVTEALALGVPVLLDAELVLPQEKAVMAHVRRNGLGRTFQTARAFGAAFDAMLSAPPRDRAAASANRSAAQIVDIMDRISAAGPPERRAAETAPEPALRTEP